MKNNNTIKIAFFGDITGRVGRMAVKDYIKTFDADFIIANVENASHGFGLTPKNYNELSDSGIDCLTSGNHIWDKKDIFTYIEDADKLLRPINYPKQTCGKGVKVFDVNGHKIAVINALGRVFMPPIDSPWDVVINEINKLRQEGVESIFIDFHAEATAEKICFAKYLANEFNTDEYSLIKGFFGTHTHVQTADEQIMRGMAYITDAGFCGANDSVIGMEFQTSLKRLSTSLPERYEIAESKTSQINGVEVLIDKTKALQIKRINVITDKNETEADIEYSTT